MRLRIVLPVLILGVLALAAVWWFRPSPLASQAEPPPVPPVAEPPSPASAQVVAPVHQTGATAAAEVTLPESVGAKHEAYVTQRCAELEDLAMDDKPESLATILGELTNRDPEIRKAAINAAVQFGSRDAIPRLLDAAIQTDDVEEKLALLEAAEFLKLPSLTELAEQAKTNATAGNR